MTQSVKKAHRPEGWTATITLRGREFVIAPCKDEETLDLIINLFFQIDKRIVGGL